MLTLCYTVLQIDLSLKPLASFQRNRNLVSNVTSVPIRSYTSFSAGGIQRFSWRRSGDLSQNLKTDERGRGPAVNNKNKSLRNTSEKVRERQNQMGAEREQRQQESACSPGDSREVVS